PQAGGGEQVPDDLAAVVDVLAELPAGDHHGQGDDPTGDHAGTEGIEDDAQAAAVKAVEGADPGPEAHGHLDVARAHAADGVDGQQQQKPQGGGRQAGPERAVATLG